MKKKNILLVFSLAAVFYNARAQNFWTRTDGPSLTTRNNLFVKNYKPAAFIAFTLNEASLKAQLVAAPSEKNISAGRSSFIVFVPNSTGTVERFKVVEAPVMSPVLAAKYPSIKTYAGKGIDEPTSTIRFDITPEGFHGMIISAIRKTIYINPVDKANHTYIVFDRNSMADPNKIFDCKTAEIAGSNIQGKGHTEKNANDGNLRTFRFAVASGGEFSELFLDGTEPDSAASRLKVLAGLVTDLARVDGITEADLGVRLLYVDKEDTLIFLDGKKDPFLSNANGANGSWNKQSQKAIDSLVGSANYDIGHLLMGYNTGGDAGCIGCVCINKQKGSGFTGDVEQVGDPFVVDYWIHEIGHQFGAFHTFDFYNEATEAQMEPGSGSTIMSYAGVAGANQNIQQHSDPYYHAISIQEITDYIQTGDGAGCAVVTATGNTVPIITAPASYIIPKSTPFKLTGQATDLDATDVLTYCWEQFDDFHPGTSSIIPKATSTGGPVFRTINPDTSSSRTFPAMSSILDGTNKNKWEVLPEIKRKLHFRLTVRDNQPGQGSNNSADMTVTIDTASGPFKVKIPNTNISWVKTTVQTVKWDVANTNLAPVTCAAVNILLSVDGGLHFDYVLAALTPNTGSADILMPDVTSKNCRIMIQAVDNIFFDVSDVNFSIAKSLPVTLISFTGQQLKQDVLLHWITTNEINNDHFDVEKSADNLHYTTIGTVAAAANTVVTQQQAYSFTDKETFAGVAYYRLKQVDKDGASAYSNIVEINMPAGNTAWKVYPNPASSKTSLHIQAAIDNMQLQLTNVNGQVVFAKNVTAITAGQVIDVPLQNLAKGIYMLKIKTAKETKTEKIIVE